MNAIRKMLRNNQIPQHPSDNDLHREILNFAFNDIQTLWITPWLFQLEECKFIIELFLS